MKKLSFKRIITAVLAFTLFAGMLPLTSAVTVSAASTWPSLSNSAYCEFKATKTIYVYRDCLCRYRGTSSPSKWYNAYIETGDTCRILAVNANYILVKYPVGNSYRTGYIKRSSLFTVSAPTALASAKGKVTTYVSPGGTSYGYTENNDKVYACGTSGNYTLIIYTAKSGSRAYKLGYVRTSDYNTTIASVVSTNNSSKNIKLNVPLFKQYDSRWSNSYIGNKTIGQVGCTTTCISMVYSYNSKSTVYPNKMVSKLSYSNNDLYWYSIANVGLTSKSYYTSVSNSMLSTIYSKLKEGRPVIIGAQTSSGGSQHWVVIVGYTGSSTTSFSTANFIVNDPGSQCASTLEEFLANGSKTDRSEIIRIMY